MCNWYVRPLCSCMSNSCLHIEKNHGVGVLCVGLGSLALTNKLLRLLVRRKATRGVALKTLAHRGDEDRMLKCL